MSPTLLRVLRGHEYWRKAWLPLYPEYRNMTAMRLMRKHKYDTRRWYKTAELATP